MHTAPRVTVPELQAEIASEWYFTGEEAVLGAYKAHGDVYQYASFDRSSPHAAAAPGLAKLTICVLVLRNGLTVVGVNHGPVDRANFNAEDGRRYARENAVEQLWPLLGFRLAENLAARARAVEVAASIDAGPGPIADLRD